MGKGYNGKDKWILARCAGRWKCPEKYFRKIKKEKTPPHIGIMQRRETEELYGGLLAKVYRKSTEWSTSDLNRFFECSSK